MRAWAGALAAAALLGVGLSAPAAAQSCGDFGNQKDAQRSLEQVGDPSGQLDPDGNGFACDNVAGQAASDAGPTQTFQQTGQQTDPPANSNGGGALIINNDGTSVSNNASGTSNTVMANPNPNAGSNGADRAPRPDRTRPDRSQNGNNAPADAGSQGAAAPMGVPVGDAGAAPQGEAAPEQAAPQGAGNAQGAGTGTKTAPIRLPNTGAGRSSVPLLPAALALLAVAGGVAAGTVGRKRPA